MTKTSSKKKAPSKKKESTPKTKSKSQAKPEVGAEVSPSETTVPSAVTSAEPLPPVAEGGGGQAAAPEPKRPRTREEILFQVFESPYRPVTAFAVSEKSLAPQEESPRDSERDRVLFRNFRWKEEEAAFLKAEAERIEAERIARKKAEAERLAREKAEAQRLEAERIAKEKAEAERREAERIAREKAEAERLEAERIAKEKAEAERLAREKAEAQRLEAERIAKEKAEAERREAERIAAEEAEKKRKAEEQAKAELAAMAQQRAQAAASVTVTYTAKCDTPTPKQEDPMDKSIKLLAACIAAILLLLIGVSTSNMCKYVVKESGKGIEIWQGRFAPMGYKLLVSLPDMQPGCIRPNAALSKAEVFPFICRYYLNKADLVIEQPGDLDVGKIKSLVREAAPYAINDDLKNAVDLRLKGLGHMADLYRAEVLVEKGTPGSLLKAKDMLKRAKASAIGETSQRVIEAKLAEIEARMAQ